MFIFHGLLSKRLAALATLALATSGAMAGLGGAPLTASALGADAGAVKLRANEAMKSSAASGSAGLYTLNRLQLASGTTITEYVNKSGVVFAVSWLGPVLPNLSHLLGTHFPVFKSESDRLRQVGKRGGPVSLNAAGLVVVSSGRMGHFSGFAYKDALIPAGVNADDLLN